MKWGVRRYQKKDGSLTPAGKKRYNDQKNNDSDTSSVDKYRQKMLSKAISKGDTKSIARYTQLSDDVIAQEQRRKNVKKAIAIGAGVVGVAAAGYIAYRLSVKNQLDIFKGPVTKDVVKDVLNKANDDLSDALKIPKGSEIHRQVGFQGFDLQKAGNVMYATTTEADRAAYMSFLKDWVGTGERYDVTLRATKDIFAPSDKTARKIFDEVWDSDPTYKTKLRETLVDTYIKLQGAKDTESTRKALSSLIDNELMDRDKAFSQGMYALVRGGDDSRTLRDAYISRGYTAIKDYFDTGVLGKQPMIFFDAKNDLAKTGEQFVTKQMKRQSLEAIVKDPSHPMYRDALRILRQIASATT